MEPGSTTISDWPRPSTSTSKVDSGPSPRLLNSRLMICVISRLPSSLLTSESNRSNISTHGPHFPKGPAIRYSFLILVGACGSVLKAGSA